MLKKLIAATLALLAAAAFAAVDANKADAAALDSVKGIGPGIAGKILEERKKGSFKDWNDLITRVNGIGETNAAKLSEGGLTVNGSTFKGMAAAPAKKEEKAAAKAAAPAAATAPAAAATTESKAADTKAAKADKKAEEKAVAKAERKTEAKAEKKSEEKAEAKAEKQVAKKSEKKASKPDEKKDEKKTEKKEQGKG